MTRRGVYYFVGNRLYLKKFGGEDSKLLGVIDENIFPSDKTVGAKYVSDDGNRLVLAVPKFLGSKPFEPYLLSKYRFHILEVDLGKLTPSDQIIETKILHEEELEGFMHLLAYDFSKNIALVYYQYDNEQKDPCEKHYYTYVDIITGTKTAVGAFVSSGRRGCTEVIHKEMFLSSDGSLVVFGQDFNQSLSGPRANKLEIHTFDLGKVTTRTFLADSNLLRNEQVQIINASNNKLLIVDTNSDSYLLSFDLNQKEYSYSRMEIIESMVAEKEEDYKNPLWEIYNAVLIHSNPDRLYFIDRELSEKKLYILNRKTKELYLPATFSVLAKYFIVQDQLYIVDTGSI